MKQERTDPETPENGRFAELWKYASTSKRFPLQSLRHDHSHDLQMIGTLVEVTRNFVPPEGSCLCDGFAGWVPSYADKRNAEKIAKRVQGVHGVANDIEVKLPDSRERNDGDLAETAVEALNWNVSVAASRIQVTVTKGWVTLEGSVERQFQKRAAENAVRYLNGVCGVRNRIRLAPRVEATNVKQRSKPRSSEWPRWTRRRSPCRHRMER